MLCNLNNVVQLENKYSLTDKILALKEQSRVSSDDCLKELPKKAYLLLKRRQSDQVLRWIIAVLMENKK